MGFLEVGRVNDEYDLSELHKDMKLSGGAGVNVLYYEIGDYGVGGVLPALHTNLGVAL